jgi:SAM-dependent methyltransferase
LRDVVHKEYLDTDHWWFRARKIIFNRLLDDLDGRPANGDVLDIGPGSDVNLPVLRDRGELTVVDATTHSLQRLGERGVVRCVQGDAERLPFADDSFDLVCAWDVIEHLDDDHGALRECGRILREGGRLFLTVPAWPLLWGRQDVLSLHKRRYRRAQLRTSLERAGFRAERLTYFNSVLFLPILVVRLLMRPFLRWSKSGGTDFQVSLPLGLDELLFRLFAMEAPWLARRDLPFGVSLLGLANLDPERE